MDSLDNIVTAVSEILLVFEEAQKDYFTDLKVETKNLETLVHSISQMVEENRKLVPQIDDDQLRQKMSQTFVDTVEASSKLENLIRSQPNGVITRPAYKPMHNELRVILYNMVLQIQITDQCNVKIVMTSLRKNLDCISRLNKVDTKGGVEAVARDLVKLSEGLHGYIRTRIAETTSGEISQRLSTGSDNVKTGVPIAIEACTKYVEHPNSDNKAQKDKHMRFLVESVQELVNAILASAEFISNFVLQFALPALTATKDDKRAPRVGQELTRLENAVKRRDPKEANAALQGLDREVAKQAQEANALAGNMKDKQAKERLLADARELERLVPEIGEATRNTLNNPNDKKAEEKFADLVKRAREVNNRIENAKKPENQALENSRLLADALKRLRDAVDRGDKDAANKAMKDVADSIARQVAYAREMAEKMKDPRNKKILLDAADELERLSPLLQKSVADTLNNPNDKAARKRFDDLTKKVEDENEKITKAILEDELYKNNGNIKSKIDELYDAVNAGESDKAADLLRDIDELVKRRLELGKELVKQTDDPKLKNQILSAMETLERDLPELNSATNQALRNPSDPKAMGRLYQVGEEIKDASDRVTANKLFDDRLPEQILANGRNLDESLTRLGDAVRRGDAKAAAAAARDVANQIAKQVAFGRRLAEECDDPVLKKKILDACDELERLSPLIVAETKNALMNPNDKDAQKRLEKLLEQARGQNKIIMDAAEIIRANRNKPKPKPKVAEPKVSDYNPNSGKDAIAMAAASLGKSARESKRTVIPEQQQLLDLAKAIAEEMEKLSVAARNNDKKEMITASRNIAGLVQQIQNFSTQIANKCTDPKLRERLQNLCRVPKNFAVQLKIISAVKATSGESGGSAEAQLITCAQGVANSVVAVVSAAEAAAISAK